MGSRANFGLEALKDRVDCWNGSRQLVGQSSEIYPDVYALALRSEAQFRMSGAKVLLSGGKDAKVRKLSENCHGYRS